MLILNIMACGGSGKDEFTKAIQQHHPEFKTVKFPEPFKKFLDSCYGYPEGASELPEYRNKVIEGTDGKTLLDMQNAAFEFTVKNDPLLMVRPAIRKAQGYLNSNHSVINNDFRNPVEIEYFRTLKETTAARLHTVLIERPSIEPRSTDRYLESNFIAASEISDTVVILKNQGTLQEFLYKVYLYRGLLGLATVNQQAVFRDLGVKKFYGLPVGSLPDLVGYTTPSNSEYQTTCY